MNALKKLVGMSALTGLGLLLGSFSFDIHGQEPGRKVKSEAPKNKEEKLQQATDAYKDSIDWSKVNIAPGPVDARLKEFLKKTLNTDGSGFTKVGEKQILVSVGEESIPFQNKPGFVTSRINAMNRAELKGRVQMAGLISTEISTGQFFERFQGYSEQVSQGLRSLKKAADSGAISGDSYKEANATFSQAQVSGAITIKTIEGSNNDNDYKVIRVLIWHPLLRDLAMNALADSDYMLPSENMKEEDLDQIPTKEEELMAELGTKVYFNKKGQRYYVSFAQAEPIAQNQDGVARAVEIAKTRAELMAKGYLARTLSAEITSAQSDQINDEMVQITKDQKTNENSFAFYERMESKSKNLKITGMMVRKPWVYKNPDWATPVVGVVVVWTPESQSVVKELGLNQKFNFSSPDNLVDFLTAKYGKAGATTSTTNKENKKAGVIESKDPKKIP
jgi:hypothetical protein